MSYDVAIFGELSFPKGGAAAWRRAAVDTKSKAVARAFPDSPDFPKTTVGAVLDALASGEETFEAKAHGDTVRVRGMVGEDTFRERARSIAAMLLAAGEHDAEGEVTIAGVGAELGYRVRAGGGKATLKALSPAEARAAEHAPEVKELGEASLPEAARAILGEAKAKAKAPPAAAPPTPAPARGDDAEAARALAALEMDEVAKLREGRQPAFMEASSKSREMRRLLGVLQAARYAPALPAVHALWRGHPWPYVRQQVERLLLDWGTADAVRPIAEKLEEYAAKTDEYDQGEGQSLAAIEAVLRSDPRGAYDRLLPYFDEERKKSAVATSIAQGVFALLGRAGTAGGPAPEQAAAARGFIEADPRWSDLALRVLRERDDGTLYGAIEVLKVTRDARAAAAIAELLEYDLVELDTIVDALRALGDGSVVKAVRKAAAARKKKKAEAAKLEALAAELEKKA